MESKEIVNHLTHEIIQIANSCFKSNQYAELQIRGGNEDNSKIIFLISQPKHML